MAENKKSFILYADLIHTISKTPDDVAGRLFKTILEYVNDKDPIIENDLLLDVLFEPIKQTLKRDLLRYEEFRNKQSENGKKGGRPKSIENQTIIEEPKETELNPKNPSLILESQKSLNDSVSVNDSVIDNVNDSLLLKKVTKVFNFKNELFEVSKDENLVNDFMLLRKNKKATNSETAFNLFLSEVDKSKLHINEVLKICISKDWKGFKNEWIIENKFNKHNNDTPKRHTIEAYKAYLEQPTFIFNGIGENPKNE